MLFIKNSAKHETQLSRKPDETDDSINDNSRE